jgi:type IV pilus assembly protein PilW
MKIQKMHAGFTLLEVMISLAIFAIVLAGVVKIFTSTGMLHTSQEQMMEVTQNIRAIKHMMVDEIRSARCNPLGKTYIGFRLDAGNDKSNTDANSIHFTRDIDNGDSDEFYEPDGDANDPDEDVAYFRTGDAECDNSAAAALAAGDTTPGCLRRDTGGGGQPVAENITDLQFIYYKNVASVLTPIAPPLTSSDFDSIKVVEVYIKGRVQSHTTVSPPNREWEQRFKIVVRNPTSSISYTY